MSSFQDSGGRSGLPEGREGTMGPLKPAKLDTRVARLKRQNMSRTCEEVDYEIFRQDNRRFCGHGG